MTITYDTDPNTNTMAAAALSNTMAAPALSDPTESVHAYHDDPDTYTIAQAWVSSPLGELDGEIGDDFAPTEAVERQQPEASRAKLFAVLAAGIIGGATLGAVLFGSIHPGQPTFVVPWGAVKTSPSQPVSTPSCPVAQPKPAAEADPAPMPAEQAPAPKPIVSEAKTNQVVLPAPAVAVDPAIPPASAPPVIVPVFIPPLPPLPDTPDKPEPPDLELTKTDTVVDIDEGAKVDQDPPKKLQIGDLASQTKLDMQKSIELTQIDKP